MTYGMRHIISNKPRTAIFLAVAVLSVSLCACKGRRASDMVPNGDTVEVVIEPASVQGSDADTINSNYTINNEI